MIKILFIFLFIIISCSNNENKEHVNGNSNKSNLYSNSLIFSMDYALMQIDSKRPGAICPPISNKNAKTYLASSDNKIMLLYGKNPLWEYDLGGQKSVQSNIVTDKKGSLYAILNGSELLSINEKGKLNWKKEFGTINESLIYSNINISDDRLYFGNSDGDFFIFDTSGNMLLNRKSSLSAISDFPVSNQHFLLPITSNDYETPDSILFFKDTDLKNSLAFENSRLITSPVITDSYYYVPITILENSGRKELVNIYDSKFKLINSIEIDKRPFGISATNDGTIYIVTKEPGFNSSLLAYNIKGDLLWDTFINYSPRSKILIAKDYLALYATGDNTKALYYIDKNSGTIINTLSMSNCPQLIGTPSISESGSVVFVSSQELSIVVLDNGFFD